MTTLIQLVSRRNFVGAQKFLEDGGDVHEDMDPCGEPILWCYSDDEDFEVWIDLFMKHGATIKNICLWNGRTMYHVAVHSSLFHLRILELCEQHELDINEQDMDGMTPLHLACCHQNVQAVKWLISKGADVNLDDRYGTSVLDIVVDPISGMTLDYIAITLILLKHGAKPNKTKDSSDVRRMIKHVKMIISLASVHRVPRLCKGDIRLLPPELMRVLAGHLCFNVVDFDTI